jgi:hypothetical protein
MFVDKQMLAVKIKETLHKRVSINMEGSYIVCRSKDPVDFAFRLSNLFGIEKVAVAKEVSSNFSELAQAIVEIGSKIIKPGISFYVKVIQDSAEHDFVSRDLEFTACGSLTARLSTIHARPAKSELEAGQLLLIIVGKKSAYVCIKLIGAHGGLLESSNGHALSSIHSSLSFLSTLMAVKAGFECSIVLPYTDETDLERNAKLAELLASKTRKEKQTFLLMPINLPQNDVTNLTLVKEIMISQILMNQKQTLLVFPFTIAIHPLWFIKDIMQETLSAGKTPFTPLIFMSNELVSYARENNVDLNKLIKNFSLQEKLQKSKDTIDYEVKEALKHSKRIELTIGPNYLHDIIDAI